MNIKSVMAHGALLALFCAVPLEISLANVKLSKNQQDQTIQTNTVTVKTKNLGAEIHSTMYGVFFEDINYGADGGLYAELVKNRSFEFTPDHFMGWHMFGNVALRNDGPFERNPHYVRLGSS